jgi:hypothetical protein
MDLNFPKPMLNSPAESGAAAGNAFYMDVQRRVEASRESRRILIHETNKQAVPDYAEIVSQINLCLAEIRPHVPMVELTQMLTNPTEEIENLLKKLQKMRPSVQ